MNQFQKGALSALAHMLHADFVLTNIPACKHGSSGKDDCIDRKLEKPCKPCRIELAVRALRKELPGD